MEEKVNKVSMPERFLGSNKLPSTVMLFMYLFIIIAVIRGSPVCAAWR